MKPRITLTPRNRNSLNVTNMIVIGGVVLGLTALTIALFVLFNIGNVGDVRGKAAVTLISSGSWSDGSVWDSGYPPAAADNVAIGNGYKVILDGDAICALLELNAPLTDGKTELKIDNGYSLFVGGDFVLNGGNTNNRASHIILKDASALTVEGDLVINSSSDRCVVIDMSSGTSSMNLQGAFVLNSAAKLTSSNSSIVNFCGTDPQIFPASYGFKFKNVNFNNSSQSGIVPDGVITQNIISGNLSVLSGIFDNDGFEVAGKGDKTLEVADGAIMILRGSTSFPTGFKADLKNASTVSYAGQGGQPVANQDYGNLVLCDSGAKTFPVSQPIRIAGDFNSQCSNYLTTNSQVIFIGSSEQRIVGNAPFTFYDLEIDNASGVALDIPVAVNNALIMATGMLTTSLLNTMTINANAVVIGGSPSAFINGPVVKNIASTVCAKLPVGKSGNYRPVSIKPQSSAASSFIVEYFDTAYTNTYSLPFDVDHVSKLEYFQINRAGSANAKITLSWDNNSAVEAGGLADLVVAHWDGTAWNNMGNTAVTGNYLSGTVTSDVVNSFSPFALGSKTILNPLPIELLRFSAEPEGQEVMINWATVSEVNNDFFTLERSSDGFGFEEIATINGAGSSNTAKEYRITDKQPLGGMSYYRLKQTDFDGQFKYFRSVPVQFNRDNSLDYVLLAPNPFSSDFTLEYRSGNSVPVEVVILNIRAQVVYREVIITSTGGNSFRFDKGNDLENGIYFVNLVHGDHTSSYKVIKI